MSDFRQLFRSTSVNVTNALTKLSESTEEVEKQVLNLERRLKECEGAIEMCKELEKRLGETLPSHNHYSQMMVPAAPSMSQQSTPRPSIPQPQFQSHPPPPPSIPQHAVSQPQPPRSAQPQPQAPPPPAQPHYIDVPQSAGPDYLPSLKKIPLDTIPEEESVKEREVTNPSNSRRQPIRNPYEAAQTAEQMYLQQQSSGKVVDGTRAGTQISTPPHPATSAGAAQLSQLYSSTT